MGIWVGRLGIDKPPTGKMGHCRDCGKPTRSHKLESKFYQDVMETEKAPEIVMVEVPQWQCHVCWEKAKTPEEL